MSMPQLQNQMQGDRVMNIAAVVSVPQDGSQHWDVINGQLLIHCVGKNTQTPFWCHAAGTRLGRGLWHIPDPGTEVLIGFDDGDVEGDAFLIGTYGKNIDSGLDATTTLILDSSVQIRQVGSAVSDAQGLLTVADGNALVQAITNAVPTPMDGGAALQASILTGLSSWPTGTTILKAQ